MFTLKNPKTATGINGLKEGEEVSNIFFFLKKKKEIKKKDLPCSHYRTRRPATGMNELNGRRRGK